jgi:3-phenylpropionate/trans-cinnamate dioxygenase ferredoxin reductase subunit
MILGALQQPAFGLRVIVQIFHSSSSDSGSKACRTRWAKAVAADLVGLGKPYKPHPWFWSDQYDTKLQIAGLFHDYTDVVSRQGRSEESHRYFDGRRFLAVEAINETAAFMTGRKLLEAGMELGPTLTGQPEF